MCVNTVFCGLAVGWALGFGLSALGFRLWAFGFRLWAFGFGLSALGFRLCMKYAESFHIRSGYS